MKFIIISFVLFIYLFHYFQRVDEFFNNKIKYLVTDRPKKEWPEKIINSKGLHNCIDSNDQFSNHSSISLPTTYAGVTSGNKGETLKVSQQFNCNFHQY